MQMLSGCPEEYELDGNLFPFMNPLIIIVKHVAHRRMKGHCIFIYLFIFWGKTKCNLLDLFLIHSRHDERSS